MRFYCPILLILGFAIASPAAEPTKADLEAETVTRVFTENFLDATLEDGLTNHNDAPVVGGTTDLNGSDANRSAQGFTFSNMAYNNNGTNWIMEAVVGDAKSATGYDVLLGFNGHLGLRAVTSTKWQLHHGANTGSGHASVPAPSDGDHVAIVFTEGGTRDTLAYWLNGRLVTSLTTDSTNSQAAEMGFGLETHVGAPISRGFDGSLSAIAFSTFTSEFKNASGFALQSAPKPSGESVKVGQLPASSPTQVDLDIIRKRIRAQLTPAPSKDPEAGKEAIKLIESMTENGSWADIPYGNKNAGPWPPLTHISRIREIAAAIAMEGSPIYEDAKAKEAAMRAVDYWISNNFQSRNWWYNKIATPGHLSNAILLLGEPLSEEQRVKAARILGRASVHGKDSAYKDWVTGANLVNQAESVLRRGVIENDLELVASIFQLFDENLKQRKDTGVKPDNSFHQHGPLLYNRGYGSVFVNAITNLAVLANGTEFAFSPEAIAEINTLLLDGLEWMDYRGTYDWGAMGRGIGRPGRQGGWVGPLADKMSNLPGDRKAELLAAAARARGDADAPPMVGNCHFWNSDIMVHRRPHFYASARGHSMRTLNTDPSNKTENFMSKNLADGANCLLQTGVEYDDIFPIWDWTKVPGTTVFQVPVTGQAMRVGKRPFVGGVSDGTYGFAAMDYGQNGLVWRKSWCFFDDSYICLGSGITHEGDIDIATTLDQRFLDGAVTVHAKGATTSLKSGEHELTDVEWLHHGGTGYVFPQHAPVSVSNIEQTGSWKHIHRGQSDEPITAEVFKAWIRHGQNPSGDDYAYIVLPGVKAADMPDHREAKAIRVIKNTWEQHAVRHDDLKISGIAFHVIGSVKLHDKLAISVDRRCLVLVREDEDELHITISNPRNTSSTVTCKVHQDGKESVMTFSLPGDGLAGSSVTQKLP